MLPGAYIVHQLNSRVRLRLDEMRHNDEFFDQAIDELSTLDCLSNFNTNRVSGSIVLHYADSEWSVVADELEKLNLFKIVKVEKKMRSPAMGPVLSNIHRLNREIYQGSNGRVDLRTIAYLALMLLTIRQILQGHILGPALPMLMHAWSLAEKIDRFDYTEEIEVVDDSADIEANADD